MIQLNQARSKPDTVDRPVRTARTFVHHYNSTQYCNTETAFLIFLFLQTNITSQMWPRGTAGCCHQANSIALSQWHPESFISITVMFSHYVAK